MANLDWLIARPIAHRGLHDAGAGIVENTPSAFAAAVAANYAIECDVQVTADGEAMVYHDDALGRLTEGADRLETMTAGDLKRVAFRATADHMLTLGELCDLVAGRVTLVVELKSRFDGDMRLVARTAAVLSGYGGAAAVMSFDPAPIAAMRAVAPALARGMVGQSRGRRGDSLLRAAKRAFAYARHARHTRPNFIAYSVQDLPATVPLAAGKFFALPVLTWTVRTEDDRRRAKRWADQMIFEGFRP